jgi:hypothetical protein
MVQLLNLVIWVILGILVMEEFLTLLIQSMNFHLQVSKSVKMKVVSEFGCVDSSTQVLTLQESPKADFSWGAACNLTNTCI